MLIGAYKLQICADKLICTHNIAKITLIGAIRIICAQKNLNLCA